MHKAGWIHGFLMAVCLASTPALAASLAPLPADADIVAHVQSVEPVRTVVAVPLEAPDAQITSSPQRADPGQVNRLPATSQGGDKPTAPDATAPVAGAAGRKGPIQAGNPPVQVGAGIFASNANDVAAPIRIVLGLTVLALLPAVLVCLTAFLRIIIVLSMLRHAIGMPDTPPNTVLIGLALFLTMFTMSPVLETLDRDALRPFMQGRVGMEASYVAASQPLREFMIKQTREQDLALMVELSKAERPRSMSDISNVQLIPAFMLSELRAAFQIGFVVFLPFLLIDLIVSSVLMALGMMMMPPITVALPLKVLMFILVDGWSLILKALVASFH